MYSFVVMYIQLWRTEGGPRINDDYLVLHSSVAIYVLLFTGGCKRWSIGIISYLQLL